MKAKKRVRNTIYKILLFCIAVFFCFSPVSGGSDIGSRLMANSMGIDGGEEIQVTVEAISEESESKIGRGGSFIQALGDINSKEGRYVEMAHCGLIVLGEDLNTKQAEECLMALLSDGKINAGVSVITTEGSAKDFINEAMKLSGPGGASEYITFLDEHIHIGVEKLITFLSKINSKSAAVCLPVIAAVKEEGEAGGGTEANSSESSGAQPKPNDEEKSQIILRHTAKTYGEKEIMLGASECRGYDWLINTTGDGALHIENFVFEGENRGIASTEIVDKSCNLKVTGADSAQFSVDTRLHITDREKLLDLLIREDNRTKEVFDALKEQFSAKIKADLQALVDFCKREHIDLLGLCNEMYKYRPRDLKPPAEMLDSVNIEVVVNMDIY